MARLDLRNRRGDVVMFDPVGGPVKRARAAVETSCDRSSQPGHPLRLEPLFMQVCEKQAAVHVRNHGMMDGEPIELDSTEI